MSEKTFNITNCFSKICIIFVINFNNPFRSHWVKLTPAYFRSRKRPMKSKIMGLILTFVGSLNLQVSSQLGSISFSPLVV